MTRDTRVRAREEKIVASTCTESSTSSEPEKNISNVENSISNADFSISHVFGESGVVRVGQRREGADERCGLYLVLAVFLEMQRCRLRKMTFPLFVYHSK